MSGDREPDAEPHGIEAIGPVATITEYVGVGGAAGLAADPLTRHYEHP
jgi:hypothetical protein